MSTRVLTPPRSSTYFTNSSIQSRFLTTYSKIAPGVILVSVSSSSVIPEL